MTDIDSTLSTIKLAERVHCVPCSFLTFASQNQPGYLVVELRDHHGRQLEEDCYGRTMAEAMRELRLKLEARPAPVSKVPSDDVELVELLEMSINNGRRLRG